MPPAYPKPQLPIKEGIPSSAVPDVNALPLEKFENLFWCSPSPLVLTTYVVNLKVQKANVFSSVWFPWSSVAPLMSARSGTPWWRLGKLSLVLLSLSSFPPDESVFKNLVSSSVINPWWWVVAYRKPLSMDHYWKNFWDFSGFHIALKS